MAPTLGAANPEVLCQAADWLSEAHAARICRRCTIVKRRGTSSPEIAAPAAIRNRYAATGVDAFYRVEGASYRNPHEPALRRCLTSACSLWQLDLVRVLDLACGSGEATLALRALGCLGVEGVDPYTGMAYRARTGQEALPLNFAEVAAGALDGQCYSLIVCSFALHLAEPSRLPLLAARLAALAPALLVLTPHKRPHLHPAWGWQLRDEFVQERVRARLYDRSG